MELPADDPAAIEFLTRILIMGGTVLAVAVIIIAVAVIMIRRGKRRRGDRDRSTEIEHSP